MITAVRYTIILGYLSHLTNGTFRHDGIIVQHHHYATDLAFVHHAVNPNTNKKRQSHILSPQISSNSPIRRNLSFNLNGGWNQNSNQEEDDDDNNDNDDVLSDDRARTKNSNNLPKWARGLAFYEPIQKIPKISRIPTSFLNESHEQFLQMLKKNTNSYNTTSTTNRNITTKTIPKIENSPISSNLQLTSLINVEALLLASEQVTNDETVDWSIFMNNRINTIQKLTKGDKEDGNEGDVGKNKENNPSKISSQPSGQVILDILPSAKELGDWNFFAQGLQQSLKEMIDSSTRYNPTLDVYSAAEQILKDSTLKIESFLYETTPSFSPDKVQDFIVNASRLVLSNQGAVEDVVAAAEAIAKQQGFNVTDTATLARDSTKGTIDFLEAANGFLVSGYVSIGETDINTFKDKATSKPLFHRYKTANVIPKHEYVQALDKGSEMAMLSGAIYQDTVRVTHELGHSFVADGVSAEVAWMVTDSIGNEQDYKSDLILKDGRDGNPTLLRTITIRGFDASDDATDRERLLNQICFATPASMKNDVKVAQVHQGLLEVATDIYNDIVKFIDMTGPNHKVVLNGHSIGGSLSLLVMLLLVENRGVEFVRGKILRVFTFGSPPVILADGNTSLLKKIGLPDTFVYNYIQPWDPIVRLFSRIDALYPIVSDIGEDGVTLYASGPSRTLRPILRSILEAWEGWSSVRDNYRETAKQVYTSVGIQHLLLPEPGRYLSDRLLSVNIGTYPVEEVIRISPEEMYDALQETFPLDEFSISFIPAALRSFIHHFYPAYGSTFVDYAAKKRGNPKKVAIEKEKSSSTSGKINSSTTTAELRLIDDECIVKDDQDENTNQSIVQKDIADLKNRLPKSRLDWADHATRWVLGDKFKMS